MHMDAPVSGTCDLLIPVFNRPDALRDLLGSVAAHTNRALLGRIWIGDDASDSFTRNAIDELIAASGLPITIIYRDENIGFAANCNDLFARSDAAQCIILNTDVVLPPLWLERMLAPFGLDHQIALATPLSTNAANHTVRLMPGQDWREADRLLAGKPPSYPDDCTAIGFCMAVDRTRLAAKEIPLFDPSFGRGYGEDTDLHYRTVTTGLRSVIVDNLLVHHAGGASFAAVDGHEWMRRKGEKLFRERWGETHARAHAAFEKKGALRSFIDTATKQLSFRASPRHLDVLVVLPNMHQRFGGVWLACRMIQSYIDAGFSAAAFVPVGENLPASTALYGFEAFYDLQQLEKTVSSVGCVIGTSDATLGAAWDLSQRYGATEALLLQNMETMLRSGRSIETFLHYGRIKNVICVSECLRDYISLIHPEAKITTLRIGPDPSVFYPRDIERVPRTVAVAVNAIPEKGFTHAMHTALLLRDRGFRITLFGWDTESFPVDPAFAETMRDTSREALAYLFSRTEFILDQSYLEGLGLLPLEAAFCGCIPILSLRGPQEYIFTPGKNCIDIPGMKTLGKTLRQIDTLSDRAKNKLRRHAMVLRDRSALPQGLLESTEALRMLSGANMPVPPRTLSEYALSADDAGGENRDTLCMS